MWIKICGNTNLEDARAAAEEGADALGFVFAPSPRRVTAALVRRITAGLPPEVETYGVFVNAGFAEIVETVTAAGLTGVQLHRPPPGNRTEANLPSRLRLHFDQTPARLRILGVLKWSTRRSGRDRGAAPAAEASAFDRAAAEYSRNPAIDAVLVDASIAHDAGGTGAHAAGGTGIRFDWSAARDSFFEASPRLRMIVAGGLCPENVGEAIFALKPWGVDVVSGVEAAPGKKDRARVRAFIQAAREAAAGEATAAEDRRSSIFDSDGEQKQ